MRKYVEPEMKVMTINLKENIAASCSDTLSVKKGNKNLVYCVSNDGFIVESYTYTQNNGGKITITGDASSCLQSNHSYH